MHQCFTSRPKREDEWGHHNHGLCSNCWVILHQCRSNFHRANAEFVEPLLLEAVELDDIESIEAVLTWRDLKTRQIGLTDVDNRLLKMQRKAQEVIITASIKNNFPVVRILHKDGYKIFDKMVDDRFFFTQGVVTFS